jgi:hypothetical protein
VDVIPELRVPEADIHLYFLSTNDIFFNNRSEDPWYRITRENWYNISDSAMLDIVNDPLQKVWVQAEAASPLGCILQEQYCNPNRPQSDQEKCGPLSAPGYAEERALSAGVFDDTEGMRVRLGWLTSGWGSASNPIFLIRILGSYALKGRRALLDSSQGVVPRNQWTLDVEYWHRMAMASIQAGLIETAAGPSDRKVDVFYTKRPQKAEETKLCNGQVRFPWLPRRLS